MATTATLKEMNRSANKNNRWMYVSQLGEGSFGTVFLARDKQHNGKFVAIKVIKAKASLWQLVSGGKPSQVKDGKQEAQMLFRLIHKHVLEIYDTFEFKKLPFTRGLAIVTEYCSKGNLHECLKRNGSPPLQNRLCWYRELALGIEFIHSNGVIHRDLKPANILIDSKNSLKIADVGLAKALWDIQKGESVGTSAIEERNMTTISGTPAYMAPEVLTGSCSVQYDIFSLGLVFCVMVECPNPLVPLVQHANASSSLGQVLLVSSPMRNKPGTQVLNMSGGTSEEKTLFDLMLKHRSRERPTASELVVAIDKLKDTLARSSTPPLKQGSRLTMFSHGIKFLSGNWKMLCILLVVTSALFGLAYYS